jgi:putative toxin-antitoxin system antitoxin component (TIGR02293 family)
MDAIAQPRDIARFQEFVKTRANGPYAYTVLLGMELRDMRGIMKAIEKGFSWRTFERLARNMGVPPLQVAEMIGIPKRTLARRKIDQKFQAEESDRLLRVARVFGRTMELFDGDRDGSADWLTHPQRALGRVPLEMLRTEFGAREVENVIGALEYGVFL